MSNHPKKRGAQKRPEDQLYHRRYFSLPPDVVKFLDEQPSGQRSRVVAEALKLYQELKDANEKAPADERELFHKVFRAYLEWGKE